MNYEFRTVARTRQFVKEMVAEVSEAREKFPKSRRVFAALIEEVGELSQALMEIEHGGINKKTGKPYTRQEAAQEAIQVAAMACRLATEGDPITFPSYDWPYDE